MLTLEHQNHQVLVPVTRQIRTCSRSSDHAETLDNPTITVPSTCQKKADPESFPYGSPDLRRLRAGRYRVFYTIDEDRKLVQINHVARLP
jgi:hypothetical protein